MDVLSGVPVGGILVVEVVCGTRVCSVGVPLAVVVSSLVKEVLAIVVVTSTRFEVTSVFPVVTVETASSIELVVSGAVSVV